MRVAIIDLGTNSVRFDVHSLGQRGKLLHREKLMIRLGQGVFLKGKMDAHAMERAVQAFAHFRRVAEGLRVGRVVAFGTSALREAQNSALLLEKVKEASGIEIKVISGKEESKLIALGILANEEVPRGRYTLVDIGGGSTEISICRGRKILCGNSFPLGTARLQQVFLKRSPPRAASILQLKEYVRNILEQRMQGESWPRAELILGSSGTVKAISKILGRKIFSVKQLSGFVNEISGMTTTQLLDIPGMEAKRVDMILGGALLLEETARMTGARRVKVTEFSLRDGIIEEERRLAKSRKSSLIELHLDDLFARAARFGLEEGHLRHMVDLAGRLFDGLKHLHRLESRWKIYLLSTVILRNTGEIVGYAGKERHSYYVVKNSDFPAMQGWEHEFIARLCLHHSGGKLGKDLSFLGKDKTRHRAFLKILALVRVIDALDLGPRTAIRIRRIQSNARQVKLQFGGAGTAGTEQLMIERKKRLFEEVFGRQLLLERVGKG